jgi:hypothetical protein
MTADARIRVGRGRLDETVRKVGISKDDSALHDIDCLEVLNIR